MPVHGQTGEAPVALAKVTLDIVRFLFTLVANTRATARVGAAAGTAVGSAPATQQWQQQCHWQGAGPHMDQGPFHIRVQDKGDGPATVPASGRINDPPEVAGQPWQYGL